jgi:hypothetical protein
MLLVLIPFFAVREVSAALGPGGLKRILMAPPGRAGSRHGDSTHVE